MQQAYDGLCIKSGTTAVPYFIMKYTDDVVQLASLGDWDKFFTDAKKVLHQLVLWVFFNIFNLFKATEKKKKKINTI